MSLEKEQYVIVTRNWVLLCPESVDSRLKAEWHLANVVGYHEDCVCCPVKTFYDIRNDLISFLKCTQSFDQTDVWFGVAGMQNWVELAGMSNKLIGNAYEWAKEELESRGLEPHWVVNLQEALGIFSRAPLPTIKGGGDTALKKRIPQIGTFIQGGYYAGLVNINGITKALIVAPKAQGEYVGKWAGSQGLIAGATCTMDGRQNTLDMIAAGVELGIWVESLDINGVTDWHIPSQVELYAIYRVFNPTSQILAFREGGPEAFDKACYSTSTQINGTSVWTQLFEDGYQAGGWKYVLSRARAVRTINVSDLVSQ